MKDIIGGTEEQYAIQPVLSTWLREKGDAKVFKGHLIKKRGNERSFSYHVIGKGGDEKVSVTTWLGEEVIQKRRSAPCSWSNSLPWLHHSYRAN